jgi:thiamine biosynthesis lipoprotein
MSRPALTLSPSAVSASLVSPVADRAVTRSFLALGTVVSFRFYAADPDDPALGDGLADALGWIEAVDRACSRFDPGSEVAQLAHTPGTWVPVSALLAGALETALRLAAITDGAFDAAIGQLLSRRDPSGHHLTGERWVPRALPDASFRDIEFDQERSRVRLRRPVLLDLGAVAKGMAVDLAARALRPCAPCSVDAGGDVYLVGQRPGEPWRAGIAGGPDRLLGIYTCNEDQAICTSGPWFRPTSDGGHHLIDARTKHSVSAARSATVIAASAMIADAAATAAFILGPENGIALFGELGVDGLVQASNGRLALTSNWLQSTDPVRAAPDTALNPATRRSRH